MTRRELEHIIRASGAIAEVEQLIVIGSQAILGAYPDAPPVLLRSMEADVYPPGQADLADLIDGSIGEDSLFHETFGYFAHGVGPETATLPADWRTRLVSIRTERTNGVEGLCLSPVDLAVSKILAGRPKDREFVQAMVSHDLVTLDAIREVAVELPGEERDRLLAQLGAL